MKIAPIVFAEYVQGMGVMIVLILYMIDLTVCAIAI